MQVRSFMSPVGRISLAAEGDALCRLDYNGPQGNSALPVLLEAERQLQAYFRGELKEFDLPLAPQGTNFQKRVWQGLCAIPYGEVWSYKDLAEYIGCHKGYQAVGQANGKNPISIIIPCHRVIAADGSIGGYTSGLAIKRVLLELEGIKIDK